VRFENTNIQIFYDTAKRLGILVSVLRKNPPKIALHFGRQSHVIARKSMGLNSPKAIKLTRSKQKTQEVFKRSGLPILKHTIIYSIKGYQKASKKISFPQVIKPTEGQKGKYVFLNVCSLKDGQKALKQLFTEFTSAIIEPYFKTPDYRFCVLGGKVIGLSERIPPQITGDSKHNIRKLIEIENERRHKTNLKLGRRMLNRMRRWRRIRWYLESQGKSYSFIPKKGEKTTIYPLPNFTTGGSVRTINPKSIHPSFSKLAEKAAKTLNLTLCGVDILIKDLKKPASPQNCAVIEVNSDPGIRLHEWPNEGTPQPVARQILHFIAQKYKH